MPGAYITEPGAAIRRRGQSLVVTKDGEVLADLELIHLEALVLVGRVSLTTPAATTLLSRRVPVAFVGHRGEIAGRLTPALTGSIDVRLGQFTVHHDPARRLMLARRVVDRKLESMQELLSRYAASYPELEQAETRARLARACEHIARCGSLSELLGVEGAAASAYWTAFGRLNRSVFPFPGRRARPATDPINALLGFGYALLVREIAATLEAQGLDPYLGYYHAPRPNRPALALDVMEPLRHAVVDAAVLRACNTGRFRRDHFATTPNGAARLERPAIKLLCAAYEDSMEGTSGRSSPRTALRGQAERLATFFRRAGGRDDLAEPRGRAPASAA